METKMITIPFDIERAKKIQAGEEPGKIVTRDGSKLRIICWDKKGGGCCIIALVADDKEGERVEAYMDDGSYYGDGEESGLDLVLQVPEWTQFKDGDILACKVDNGNGDYCKWFSILRSKATYIISSKTPLTLSYAKYNYDASSDANLLSFNDISDSIDSIRLATEEEKQMFINRLKKEKDTRAKECLKRFFGIEGKHKFEPFDKVLVRDNDNKWCTDFFSHFDTEEKYKPFICVGCIADECIPYNDQTKHLLGTTDDWEE